VRPVTVADVSDPDTVELAPPGFAVTVYELMALPPLDDGGVHETVAWALPEVAVTLVGGPATAAGVTALDGVEAGPGPTALAAVTVNVYDVPLVRPATVAVVCEPATVTVAPPGLAVTTYEVIELPPFEDGADHVTVAEVLPGAADTFKGLDGTVAGVTALDGADAVPAPTALVAITVNV